MNGKYFLDTDIILCSFDKSDQRKSKIATQLIKKALEQHSGCISNQVVQEFLNVATKKFSVPLTASDSKMYLSKVLAPLCQVFTDIDLYMRSVDIMERWQYSLYDSMIIAAALQAECSVIYSEHLQDQQVIHDATVINPFVQKKLRHIHE